MNKSLMPDPAPRVGQIIAGHFREGRGYGTHRPHGTQDWLMIATLDGSGRFRTASGEFSTQPGDYVLLRPGTTHDYGVSGSSDAWELLWTHFHPYSHWRESLGWPEHAPGLMRLSLSGPERAHITARFFDVYHTTISGAFRREAFAMNALEDVLLRCEAVNPLRRPARIDARVLRALEYLQEHFAEPVSLKNLAHRAGLSESRLGHLFREQTGLSPQQAWEEQRMTRAQQLLDLTDRSVQIIAAEVGYESAFYFSTRFKRRTGQSPTDFRRSRRT